MDLIPNRTRGYGETTDKKLRNAIDIDASNRLPAGGLGCDVEDLVKFAIATRDGTLIRKATFAEMIVPQKLENGEDSKIGLGWAIGLERFGAGIPNTKGVVWHGGQSPGVTTMLYFGLPDRDLVVSVLTNKEELGLPLAKLCDEIVHLVLGSSPN